MASKSSGKNHVLVLSCDTGEQAWAGADYGDARKQPQFLVRLPCALIVNHVAGLWLLPLILPLVQALLQPMRFSGSSPRCAGAQCEHGLAVP